MRINVDLPDLKAFCALARYGSFTRTAAALALTPSALSRRIAKLEEALGGRLVERTTRTMLLTPLGARLVARLSPTLDTLDECLVETARVAAGLEGRLVVACVASIAQSIFPEALAVFHERYPDLRVSLRDDNGARVRAAVLEREVEFGITPLWEHHADLVTELVTEDAYHLMCSKRHELAKRTSISWDELSEHRVLSFNPNSATRLQIDEVLTKAGVALPWFDEVDSFASIMGHLELGKFIAILPGLSATGTQSLAAIPLTSPRIKRDVFLIRRKDAPLSGPAQVLWDTLKIVIERSSRRSGS
jgi:DNA-binding transcriptional LysR family regulator